MKKFNFEERIKFIFESLFIMSNRLQVMTDKYFQIDRVTFKEWLLTMYINQKVEGLYAPDINDLVCQMNLNHLEIKDIAEKLVEKNFLQIENAPACFEQRKFSLTEQGYDFWFYRKYKENALAAYVLGILSGREINLLFKMFCKLYKHIHMLFNDREEIFKGLTNLVK